MITVLVPNDKFTRHELHLKIVRSSLVAVVMAVLNLTGCATLDSETSVPPAAAQATEESTDPAALPSLVTVPHLPGVASEVYGQLQAKRIAELERSLTELRQQLVQREGELTAIESHLIENHGRADVVSALAEAQVQIQRAARDVPWRAQEIDQANKRLALAERHIEDGNYGAAAFFIYRVSSTAGRLSDEARQVNASKAFINAERVNLRAGPSKEAEILDLLSRGTLVFSVRKDRDWVQVRTVSGQEGWIHASLVGSVHSE